jgi:lipid A 4'-phosphatase
MPPLSPIRGETPFWRRLPDSAETATVAVTAAAIGLVSAALFTIFPSIDLAASAVFHDSGRFALAGDGFWQTLREAILRAYTLWYIAIPVCLVVAMRSGETVARLDARKWGYLALCSIAGPLLLTNVFLKEHWGRWRPREILDFGGSHPYTTPFDISGSCADNCSFVSGEVSSMVMAFIALAFVSSVWRPVFYVLAIVLGMLSALIRVGQGGHFLSDSILAGVFMTLVAAGLYWAMFLRRGQSD